MKKWIILLLLPCFAFSATAFSHEAYRDPHRHQRKHHHNRHGQQHYRFAEALQIFQSRQPCPSTGASYGACPGYIIVKHARANHPSSFHWQVR
ncbi:MAG: hypothetical protein HQM06_13730 [Magnetococcales bacterium]|nr:hypothetical protein [Magnetococcales bacterium]